MDDLVTLAERAKKSLREKESPTARHVFISFVEEDLDEVNLLRGQAKNENSDLTFDDYSLKEPFDSSKADYIRQGIRESLQHASVCVVYLSSHTWSSKWVQWEISEALRLGKAVIGVYKGTAPPRQLPEAFREGQLRVVPWRHEHLMRAIDEAAAKREEAWNSRSASVGFATSRVPVRER